MNGYDFIIRLRDHATTGITSIARAAGVAMNRLWGMSRGIRRVDDDSRALGGTLGKLKGFLLAAFTTAAIMGFANKVMEARAEYEKFQAVMANSFQSQDVGNGAMALLTKFAADTPYQLNELTGGFIKLINRGIYPTKTELTELGDLASSQGKGFDQLVEAILDAQTGEFERLKEFGIKASKAGDQVSLSFKGVTKTVKNNEQAIKNAILEYGNMAGVAGSMDVISKTLGGRLSNLEDQWWGFLVAVGGESNEVFGSVLDLLTSGLGFLQENLPVISRWFNILWTYIQPVGSALETLIRNIFGFKTAGDALDSFGKIMRGVLLFIDVFTTGLITVINWLSPFGKEIATVAIAWGVLNAVFALSPIGWVVIGLVALISAIGLVTNYTDGWADSWEALKVMFQLSWEQIKADFMHGINNFKLGFQLMYLSAKDTAQQIIGTFTKVGDAITLALQGDFSGAFKKIGEKVKTDAAAEIERVAGQGYKNEKMYLAQTEQRKKDFELAKRDFGITIDKTGLSHDFAKLKESLKVGKAKDTGSLAYDDFIKNGSKLGPGKDGSDKDGSGKSKKGSDGIVGGGSKLTNITINVAKMQDQIVINTVNTGEGANKMRSIIEEELNRLIGSVSAMQTT
ncbi:hypothetical protein [Sphingobacterium multivorum]